MPIVNITLYLGMVKDNENALNIAVFIMWIYAILHILVMFAKDEDLLKEPDKTFFVKWSLIILSVGTIAHSVYWGYIFVPAIWLFGMFVRWGRKHQLHKQSRF